MSYANKEVYYYYYYYYINKINSSLFPTVTHLQEITRRLWLKLYTKIDTNHA